MKNVLFVMMLGLASLSAKAYEKYSVEQAYELSKKGEIVLVDIRTKMELKLFGTVATATPLPINDPQFGPKLMELKNQNPDKPIALICATGGRSQSINKQLEEMKITGFADVPEGQVGWKKKKLPAR